MIQLFMRNNKIIFNKSSKKALSYDNGLLPLPPLVYWKIDGTTLHYRATPAEGYVVNAMGGNYLTALNIVECQYFSKLFNREITDLNQLTEDETTFLNNNEEEFIAGFQEFVQNNYPELHDAVDNTVVGGNYNYGYVDPTMAEEITKIIIDQPIELMTYEDDGYMITSRVFDNFFWNCTSIENLNQINTLKVESMENMFKYFDFLQSLDISKFDMSNVKILDDFLNMYTAIQTLNIPATNGNGLANTYTRIYGKDETVYFDLTDWVAEGLTVLINGVAEVPEVQENSMTWDGTVYPYDDEQSFNVIYSPVIARNDIAYGPIPGMGFNGFYNSTTNEYLSPEDLFTSATTDYYRYTQGTPLNDKAVIFKLNGDLITSVNQVRLVDNSGTRITEDLGFMHNEMESYLLVPNHVMNGPMQLTFTTN